MRVEGSQQPAHPATKWPFKNTVIVVGVLVIAAFLGGLLPSYTKAKRLEHDLLQARQENRMAELRDLAGMAYLQASQKNYGLAAGTASLFFERTRVVTSQATSTSRKAFEDVLSSQDKITSDLAKGDPAAISDLQTIFVKTRYATGLDSGGSPPE